MSKEVFEACAFFHRSMKAESRIVTLSARLQLRQHLLGNFL
jgi:hypothetical protein